MDSLESSTIAGADVKAAWQGGSKAGTSAKQDSVCFESRSIPNPGSSSATDLGEDRSPLCAVTEGDKLLLWSVLLTVFPDAFQ